MLEKNNQTQKRSCKEGRRKVRGCEEREEGGEGRRKGRLTMMRIKTITKASQNKK
jgi:hypothetical protein